MIRAVKSVSTQDHSQLSMATYYETGQLCHKVLLFEKNKTKQMKQTNKQEQEQE